MKQANTDQLQSYLEKVIRKGKKSRLGFFEWMSLAVSGRIDGRKGAIGRTASGDMTSSLVQKELNGCAEAQHRVIARAQLYLEEACEKAEELAADMEFQKRQIAVYQTKLLPDLTEAQLSEKRRGEECLSDSQTRNRRARELARSNAVWTGKVSASEEQFASDFAELSELKAHIGQVHALVEKSADAIRSHTGQRIDYYWTVAVRTAAKATIPVVYEGYVLPDVIAGFRQSFRAREERIGQVLSMACNMREVA